MDFIDFKNKVLADEVFAAKFADCKTPEDLVATAAKEGYNFTVEEMKGAEFIPEELEKVAGGFKAKYEDPIPYDHRYDR